MAALTELERLSALQKDACISALWAEAERLKAWLTAPEAEPEHHCAGQDLPAL
jgi:hypothetical protein